MHEHFVRNPLVGFFPLQHMPLKDLLMYKHRRVYKEHPYGLVTISAFNIFQSIRIYFTPEALMGFSSQSFLPGLKPHPFPGRFAPMLSVRGLCDFTKRPQGVRNISFEAFLLKSGSTLERGISPCRSLVLSQDFCLQGNSNRKIKPCGFSSCGVCSGTGKPVIVASLLEFCLFRP
jgi:hypothetical protein